MEVYLLLLLCVVLTLSMNHAGFHCVHDKIKHEETVIYNHTSKSYSRRVSFGGVSIRIPRFSDVEFKPIRMLVDTSNIEGSCLQFLS